MNGALHGIRVIDLTSVIAGPLALRNLGDYGASITRVEPYSGDAMRAVGAMRHPQMGSMHLQLNRNKRCIALDLKSPKAIAVMRRLVEKADVFVHNMRPSALKRLGLDYESCKAGNDSLVHVGIIGFGHRGRNRDLPAYDDLIQSASGLASLFAFKNRAPARYAPLNLADRLTGVTASHAIIAALFHRQRSGEGQAVEIPMYETLVEFLLGDHLVGQTFEPGEGPMGNPRTLSPDRRPFETRDGIICVLPYGDKHWQSFLEVAGLAAQYATDERFLTVGGRARNVDEAYAILAKALKSRTTAEWLEQLSAVDVPCAPVRSLEDLLDDPHLADAGFFSVTEHPTEGSVRMPQPPVWMSRTPPGIHTHAGRLGEHTRDVLREAGYDDNEIASLLSGDAARQQGEQHG